MPVHKRIFARKTELKADALNHRALQMIMRKFAPANWIKVDDDLAHTCVTAYVTGVRPANIINMAARVIEGASTFTRDFPNPISKVLDVRGMYKLVLYTMSFTCEDGDARIVVTVMDNGVGCTISMCQETTSLL